MDRELHERLTRARVSAYNPMVFDWVDEDAFAERLHAETGNLIERTRDDEFAARLMRRFPVAGVDEVSAYRDALVDLPDGGIALAGVRFSRGDPDKPFVDVSVIEGSVDDGRLAMVTEVLDARWSDFSPLCVRLPYPTPANFMSSSRLGVNSRVDSRIVAGQATRILASQPRELHHMTMESASDISWYERYHEEYLKLLSSLPAAREWTHPESVDDLARSVESGCVFLVKVAGQLAGVIAMPRGAAHGLRGFRVQEKFLFEAFRGQSAGTRVEFSAVEQLAPDPQDIIFGSISDGNLPSRRAAYNLGRVDIGVRIWATPGGVRTARRPT